MSKVNGRNPLVKNIAFLIRQVAEGIVRIVPAFHASDSEPRYSSNDIFHAAAKYCNCGGTGGPEPVPCIACSMYHHILTSDIQAAHNNPVTTKTARNPGLRKDQQKT